MGVGSFPPRKKFYTGKPCGTPIFRWKKNVRNTRLKWDHCQQLLPPRVPHKSAPKNTSLETKQCKLSKFLLCRLLFTNTVPLLNQAYSSQKPNIIEFVAHSKCNARTSRDQTPEVCLRMKPDVLRWHPHTVSHGPSLFSTSLLFQILQNGLGSSLNRCISMACLKHQSCIKKWTYEYISCDSLVSTYQDTGWYFELGSEAWPNKAVKVSDSNETVANFEVKSNVGYVCV